MSSQIDSAKEMAKPWSKGTQWWIVGLEGLVALGLGIYLLAAPSQAESILGRIVAYYLIVAGILQIILSFRSNNAGMDDKIALVRGLVGLIAGGLVILLFRNESLDIGFGRFLIAAGTLVYGLLGLYANRQAIGERWGLVINSVVFTLIGLLVLLGMFTNIQPLLWIGWLLVLAGVALVAYAYMLYRASQTASATAVEATPAADVDTPADSTVVASAAALPTPTPASDNADTGVRQDSPADKPPAPDA